MYTVVFIHGSGVREPIFTETFGLVQQALNGRFRAENVHIEPCYWGGTCGSGLFLGGASIPEFDTARAVQEEETGDDYLLALWALLYDDPFVELDLLSLRSGKMTYVPASQGLGDELRQRVVKLTADGDGLEGNAKQELAKLLASAGLAIYFDASRAAVVKHKSYTKAMANATEPLTDYRLAVARAIVAKCIQNYRMDKTPVEGYLPLTSASRDRIVELLVAELGGREAGVLDWVKEKAGRLVTGMGTRWLKRRRGHISNLFAPFSADIIAYQAHPQPIRNYIRKTVADASKAALARREDGQVTLIAHSLGGIAAVETLIEEPLPAVQHLITVGSQSPLLYEIDALSSLPIKRDKNGTVLPIEKDIDGHVVRTPHSLPDHFPSSWLNIYDLRDFLSYQGQPIFGDERVLDKRVDNGQPFPEAHSAYWTNGMAWDLIEKRLRGEL